MSDGLKYNDKAKQWFEGQGFSVTPEEELGLDPDRPKPDFLCSKEGHEFWVEVKSIDLPESIETSGEAFREFKDRENKIRFPGRGFVKIIPEINKKTGASKNIPKNEIKSAVLMVDRVLSNLNWNSNKAGHYVVIPKDPVPKCNEFVRIEYQTVYGPEILHSVKSQSGKYSRSYLGNLLRGDKAKIQEINKGDSTSREVDMSELELFKDDNFRVSIQLMKGDGNFRFCSVGGYNAEFSRNVSIFRDRSSKAEDQINSANRQKGDKPGIVVFFQENPVAARDEWFNSGFYGDWIEANEDDQNSLTYVCNDGFWGKKKNTSRGERENTSISAALYFRAQGRPICVYNHWAKNLLPQGLLDCKEYVPQESEDGIRLKMVAE